MIDAESFLKFCVSGEDFMDIDNANVDAPVLPVWAILELAEH